MKVDVFGSMRARKTSRDVPHSEAMAGFDAGGA
jgi:hypothetical protein